MHYTAVSYYSLGRVSPRERLREPFLQALRGRRMAAVGGSVYSLPPPKRATFSPWTANDATFSAWTTTDATFSEDDL